MSFPPRHEGHMNMPIGSGSGSDNSSSSSGHGSMGSMMMAMVFQTETATPLYANSWTPNSAGAYAGTCIFLVVLAVVARLFLAATTLQEARWLDRDAQRRYVVANGEIPLAEHVARDPDAKQMTLSENGVEETAFVVARKSHVARPWRFSVDPVRAVMDTVIVGVGYLLLGVFFVCLLDWTLGANCPVCSMLAVMTMNVGYFMSVLAGVFIGSLTVGRYSSVPEH